MTRYDELQLAIKKGWTIELWMNSRLVEVYVCYNNDTWKDRIDSVFDTISFSMLMGYYHSKSVVFKYEGV